MKELVKEIIVKGAKVPKKRSRFSASRRPVPNGGRGTTISGVGDLRATDAVIGSGNPGLNELLDRRLEFISNVLSFK